MIAIINPNSVALEARIWREKFYENDLKVHETSYVSTAYIDGHASGKQDNT